MSEKKTVDLNIVTLVNVAASMTDKLFFKAPKEQAKLRFKDLKKGSVLNLGQMTIQNTLNPALKLSLDYSQFCGPGFNFNLFASVLGSILQQISLKFQAKADLNIMKSEDGSEFLIHLPGIVKNNGQLNVMVMSFDLSSKDEFFVKLMFLDPSQYTNQQA